MKMMTSTMSNWLCTHSTKNMLLKIVHPGGRIELYDCPVLASEIMSRNPKCCVAYPHVFRHPWAVVSPDTILLLGQKFYVVPISTLRRLQMLTPRNSNTPLPRVGPGIRTHAYQSTQRGDRSKDGFSFCFFTNSNLQKESTMSTSLNQLIPREARKDGEPRDERCFMCFLPGHMLKSREDSSDNPHSSKEESSESKRENNKIGSPTQNFKSPIPTTPYNQWQPRLESVSEEL